MGKVHEILVKEPRGLARKEAAEDWERDLRIGGHERVGQALLALVDQTSLSLT